MFAAAEADGAAGHAARVGGKKGEEEEGG